MGFRVHREDDLQWRKIGDIPLGDMRQHGPQFHPADLTHSTKNGAGFHRPRLKFVEARPQKGRL